MAYRGLCLFYVVFGGGETGEDGSCFDVLRITDGGA